jgi:hypothetical protein
MVGRGGPALKRLLAITLVFVALNTPRFANAGCPSVCEITVDPPRVEPALAACVTVKMTGTDCQCGVLATVNNGCNVAVDSPMTMLRCGSQDCSSIPPYAEGHVFWPLGGVGTESFSLTLRTSDGVTHTLTTSSHVTSYETGGCGCIVGRRSRSSAVAIFALGGLFAIGRRRHGRRP